jgi:polyhydroxyalkanoate synthesis regulator phasin
MLGIMTKKEKEEFLAEIEQSMKQLFGVFIEHVDRKFALVFERLDILEKKVDALTERVDVIEARLDAHEEMLGAILTKIDAMQRV